MDYLREQGKSMRSVYRKRMRADMPFTEYDVDEIYNKVLKMLSYIRDRQLGWHGNGKTDK